MLWRDMWCAFPLQIRAAPRVDQFRLDQLLPDIGAGLRFELSKKYHLNLRLDAALGKNSYTWAKGVGEAF